MEELTLRAEHLATAINCLLPACQGNVRTDSAPQPEYCCEREQIFSYKLGGKGGKAAYGIAKTTANLSEADQPWLGHELCY